MYILSSTSSFEITEVESLMQKANSIDLSSNSSLPEEEEIVAKLKSLEVHEQEWKWESLTISRNCIVQTNTIASLVKSFSGESKQS